MSCLFHVYSNGIMMRRYQKESGFEKHIIHSWEPFAINQFKKPTSLKSDGLVNHFNAISIDLVLSGQFEPHSTKSRMVIPNHLQTATLRTQ